MCLPQRTPQEYVDLASDIATVLERLPEAQRDLCERLQAQSLSAIARELGIPRSTLAEPSRTNGQAGGASMNLAACWFMDSSRDTDCR
jgi:hypothetical protein